MLKMSRVCLFATLLALPICPVGAEENATAPASGMTPSTSAYLDSFDRMHAGMDIDFTGDPDIDFVRGMLPHHQGAVDMAQVVLKYGKDPEIRKLASDIVTAQNAEIKQMQAWLDAHPAPPAKEKTKP